MSKNEGCTGFMEMLVIYDIISIYVPLSPDTLQYVLIAYVLFNNILSSVFNKYLYWPYSLC